MKRWIKVTLPDKIREFPVLVSSGYSIADNLLTVCDASGEPHIFPLVNVQEFTFFNTID